MSRRCLHSAVAVLPLFAVALLPAPAAPPVPSAIAPAIAASRAESALEALAPFRRVPLTADRRTTELVPLPLAEFEARVRAAGRAAWAAQAPPRLAEAHYHAVLANDSLVGNAEWKVVNSGPVPSRLAVEPLQIALLSARWADRRPALLGTFSPRAGAGLELIVPGHGEQTLSLGWSARGLREPGGLRFTLQFPACPVATLDLDLPADLTPTLPRGGGLLVPLTDLAGGRRTWRALCGGASQLDLALHPTRGPVVPLLRSSQRTYQDLTPGQTACRFEFDLEAPGAGVREFWLDGSPGLRPYALTIRNLESWRIEPTADGRPAVHVHLREPTQGGKLRVFAFAPAAGPDHDWASPGLHVRGGLWRTEALWLRVPPGWQLEQWRCGNFRIERAGTVTARTPPPEPTDEPRPDRPGRSYLDWYEVALQAGLAGGAARSRPIARIAPVPAQLTVHQDSEWTIDADRSTLSSRLSVQVQGGSLTQLAVRVPPGWTVEQVEPADPTNLDASAGLASWAVVPSKPGGPAGATLRIDLAQPLVLGRGPLDLQVRAVGPALRPSPSMVLPFPDLVPEGAPGREATLAVRVRGPYLARVRVGAGATAMDRSPADFAYSYRGPQLDGELILRPRVSHLRVQSSGLLTFVNGRPQVRYRLIFTPEGGPVAGVVLFSTARGLDDWKWQTLQGTGRIEDVWRLPIEAVWALAAGVPLGPSWTAALAVVRPGQLGRFWLLRFDRPIQEPLAVQASSPGPDVRSASRADAALGLATIGAPTPISTLGSLGQVFAPPTASARSWNGQAWAVPLIAAATDTFTGELTIRPPAGSLLTVRAMGLQEVRPDQPTAAARVFRFTSPPFHLSVARSSGPTRAAHARLEDARLTVRIPASGRVLAHYVVRAVGWPADRITVHFPEGCQPLAAAVAGRWRPLPATTSDVEVPVAAGPGGDTLELLYTVPRPAWPAGSLRVPAPRLPLPVTDLRRIWWLGPGWVPVVPHLRRLPDESDVGIWFDWTARPTGSLGSLDDAAAAWQRATSGEVDPRLGESLARLARADLPADTSLIVDTDALRELALSAQSPLLKRTEAPFWRPLGLIAVPAPGAFLLTSRRQAADWQATGSSLPGSVSAAVTVAVRVGHDDSGRLRTVADWLGLGPAAAPAGLPELVLTGPGPGWTAWELPPYAPDTATVIVVRQGVAWLGGAELALVWVAAVLVIGRSSRLRFVVWLLGLTAAALALLWLPTSLAPLAEVPLIVGVVAALLGLGRMTVPASVVPPSSQRRTGSLVSMSRSSLLIVVLLGAAVAGRGGPPEATSVWIASGPEPSALVPPELLGKWQALIEKNGPPRGAWLIAARYSGQTASATALIEVHFTIQQFDDAPATVSLPLGGAPIREATLDGAPAFLQATPAGDGYTCAVRGRGQHELVVQATAAIAVTGDVREVRFSVPELPFSLLTFTAPAGSADLQALNWRGAQTVEPSPTGPCLTADLGRASLLLLRWRQGSAAPATVRVHEAALWDVQEVSAKLRAECAFQIGGALSELAIDVPARAEIVSVTVRPQDAPAVLVPSAWLRGWRLGLPGAAGAPPGYRRLTLRFQAALSGRIVVDLEMDHRTAPTAHLDLAFPKAVGATEPSEAAVAIRATGLAARVERHPGLTEMSREEFDRDFWRPARLESVPAEPVTAAFHRTTALASVRLALQPAPARARSALDVVWQLGPRRADVEATVHWTCPGSGLAHLEMAVPERIVVTDVHGPGLRGWSRSGGKVQAWLERPTNDVTLYLLGSVPHPANARAAMATPFELPIITPAPRPTEPATIKIGARPGWTVTAERLVDLQREGSASPDREETYQTTGPRPQATFRLRSVRDNSTFRLLTVAAVDGQDLTWTAILECQPPPGLPTAFVARLLGADKGVKLKPEGGRELPPSHRAGDPLVRSWLFDLPPGNGGPVRFTWSGRRPLSLTVDFALPVLEVLQGDAHPRRLERSVALAGQGAQVRAVVGLTPVVPGQQAALRRAWPQELGHVSQLWRAVDDGWRLVLTAARARLNSGSPVQIELAKHDVTAAGGGWLHRDTFELYHGAGATLWARLPPGARFLAATVDGVAVTLAADANDALPLPLTDEPSANTVCVVWQAESPAAPFDRPQLAAARLELGTAVVPERTTLWTIRVPAGYNLNATGLPSERISSAERALIEAEAQARLLRLLRDRPPGEASALEVERTQGRLEDQARLALWLAGPATEGQTGPFWQRWQALPRSVRAEGVPPVALPFAAAFSRGTAVTWTGKSDALPSPLVLGRDRGPLDGRAPRVALLLLIALLAGGLVSRNGMGRAERLAVAGALAGVAFGWLDGAPFLLLSAIAIAARIVVLAGAAARRLLGRLRPA